MKTKEDNPIRETGGCGLYLLVMAACLIGIIVTLCCSCQPTAMESPNTYWRFDPTDSGMYFNERNHKTGEVLRKFGPVPEYKEPHHKNCNATVFGFGKSAGINYNDTIIKKYRYGSTLGFDSILLKPNEHTILGSTKTYDDIYTIVHLKDSVIVIKGRTEIGYQNNNVGVTSDSYTIIGRIPIVIGIASDTIW